jgi:hypothetical protein
MYWDPHMVGVIRGVLEATKGQRMRIRGKTERGGVAMGICIETNGSVLKIDQLAALKDEHGTEARRIVLAIGMKATNASELARLTGMTAATATRFHKGQLRALEWLAFKAEHLGWFGNNVAVCRRVRGHSLRAASARWSTCSAIRLTKPMISRACSAQTTTSPP